VHAHKPTGESNRHTLSHAFIVRIWWESGLTRSDGRPLWRGQIQHAASGRTLTFQSLSELLRFIQTQTGELDPTDAPANDL
jgi:hypothetical protein